MITFLAYIQEQNIASILDKYSRTLLNNSFNSDAVCTGHEWEQIKKNTSEIELNKKWLSLILLSYWLDEFIQSLYLKQIQSKITW